MSRYEEVKLVKIFPKMLKLDKELSYHLYKKQRGKFYEKFLNSDEIFDKESLNTIENNNIEYLYIKHDDYEKYSKDLRHYLYSMVNDKNTPVLLKSEKLHLMASGTMLDLLTTEVSKSKIKLVSQSIDITVDFILKDNNAIKSMIEVTNHDYYTYTHCVDVATYALGFGAFLGLDENQLKVLGKGAMLHDLGKKKIPLEVLNKNGKLTQEEFNLMMKHPGYGVEILKEMEEKDKVILAIVEQHHEKINGSGYPKALKGNEINPLAQIVAICDIFNALTTKRSYKKPMSSYEAAKLMYEKMKEELNMKLLAKFVKFMAKS